MPSYLSLYGIAIFAYGIGNFALSIWIYQETKSIASFAAVGIAALLPAFILTPIAGIIIDRISPQKALQYSSAAMALGWLVLGGGLFAEAPIPVLYLPLIVMGAFMSLQMPAYTALIAESVEPDKHANANGLFGILSAIGGIGSPFVAGYLIGFFDISWICLIPFVALLVQAVGLSRLPSNTSNNKAVEEPVIVGVKRVFNYLRGRRELVLLLAFGLLINAVAEIAGVVVIPLGLDLYGDEKTGILMTVAGVGALVGNIVLSALPTLGNKKIGLLFMLNIVQGGLLILLTQSSMSFTVIVSIMVLFFFFEALYDGIDTSYWQGEAPEDMRASILSYKSMSSILAMLIAYVLAAPLVASISSSGMSESTGGINDLISISDSPLIALLTLVGLANFAIVTIFSVIFLVRTFSASQKECQQQ